MDNCTLSNHIFKKVQEFGCIHNIPSEISLLRRILNIKPKTLFSRWMGTPFKIFYFKTNRNMLPATDYLSNPTIPIGN